MKKYCIPFVILCLVSCVRDIDLTVDEEPLVVVECVLDDGPVQTMKLTYTKAKKEKINHPVENAECFLIDKSDNDLSMSFYYSGEGEWNINYSAIYGHDYRLEIRIPGLDLIYAEDRMPEKIEVESIHYIQPWAASHTSIEEEYPLFQGSLYRINSLGDFVWICGMNYIEDKDTYEIADNICTDFPDVDSFNLNGNIHENINGVYPVLYGASMHNRFLRIQKEKAKEKRLFCICGDFKGDYMGINTKYSCLVNYNYVPEHTGHLLFRSVSSNYDKYLFEAVMFQQYQEQSDELSNIYLYKNRFSNINGGIGIFGSCSSQKVPWFVDRNNYMGYITIDSN